MDLQRPALRAARRPDLDTSAIIAMRIAIQASACDTPTTRREHFVWPAGSRRRPFYWYAVEGIVSAHPEDFDVQPFIVEADGFARTEARAHYAAEHVFDNPRTERAFRRIARRDPARHAYRPGLVMCALDALALVAFILAALGGAAVLVGLVTQAGETTALGAAVASGGLVGGSLLRYWIEDHR